MKESFVTYRRRKGYSEKSIKVNDSHLRRFTEWSIQESIDLYNLTYENALEFISNERKRGLLNQSIVRELNSIRIYYDYLIWKKQIKDNVISRIQIRQAPHKIVSGMLSCGQLQSIYLNYQKLPQWEKTSKTTERLHQRNSVILGLLIYQGITSGDIARLEISHVKLLEGKIYIPSSRKSNARNLEMQAAQFSTLQSYLNTLTTENRQSAYLFPGKKHGDMVASLLKQVKRQYPQVTDARQIRASVIMNWLKTENIRQVQYMAGHKSIRSTEQYRSQDVSNLARQLELFHPLG